MDPMNNKDSSYGPHLVCGVCKRGHSITEKSVCLTRWTGLLNTNRTPLIPIERGTVVVSVCWECVENVDNPPSTINCYKPPLLEIEKTSILQYMNKSSTANKLCPSSTFPAFCIGCETSIAEESLCVYSLLTTEQDVEPTIKSEHPDAQDSGLVFGDGFVGGVRFLARRSWNRMAIKIQNPIDVGILCNSCATKFWGKDFAASLE